MNSSDYSRPLSLKDIQVTDAFWKSEMELVRKEVIPYQWEALNDRIEGATPSYCMRNFKVAAKLTRERSKEGDLAKKIIYPTDRWESLPEDKEHMEDRFYGWYFQDSDFAKWVEAVGYSLTQHPDMQLETLADDAIDIVCAAQQENGYLDTHYIINNLDNAFTNLRDAHELYCFGHLAEGAIAYYQATGKDKLLHTVERYADYIDSVFGSEEGKCKGYPGHEIAEMALAKLYEVTKNTKYLELGRFFIEERGTPPYYFDLEHKTTLKEGDTTQRYLYNQAHLPVRQQKEAVGHAVRGVYLYSGMADIARITGDEKLYQACETLWDNITEQKMYITGGIGGTNLGEAFSFNYDLPNDTAYAETCAPIGLVFFARRMLEMKPDSKYGDVMERALFNGILSGMALDGKSFFYVNPLEVLPEASHKDERKFHVKPVRQKWFGCACCPPNLARLLSSIAAYAYTESEDTLFVHLYMGSKVDKKVKNETGSDSMVQIGIEANFPWEGKVTISLKSQEKTNFTLALRIPDWSRGFILSDMENEQQRMKDGYLYITKTWDKEESFVINFNMETSLIRANPLVREDFGKAAVVRGPLVYCLEEADNGKNLHLISIAEKPELKEITEEFLGQKPVIITGKGKRLKEESFEKVPLYFHEDQEIYEDVELKWIPYYLWANRGEGEMQVWTKK